MNLGLGDITDASRTDQPDPTRLVAFSSLTSRQQLAKEAEGCPVRPVMPFEMNLSHPSGWSPSELFQPRSGNISKAPGLSGLGRQLVQLASSHCCTRGRSRAVPSALWRPRPVMISTHAVGEMECRQQFIHCPLLSIVN